MLRIRMTTLPFLLLALSPFVIFDSDYALRSVSWIPFRTFWWYLVEMQNRTRRHITYKSDISGFLSFGVISLCFSFEIDFMSAGNSNTHRNTMMVFGRKCRTGWDDVSSKRMTTQPSLLLALSTFVIFDIVYALISCLLCKSNTLWNILMILGSNEEQDQMTCHIQEWQLWLFLLLELSPLLVFEYDFLSLLCNMNTLQNILMILGRNVEQDEVTCWVQEWQPFLFLAHLSKSSRLAIVITLCPSSVIVRRLSSIVRSSSSTISLLTL